MDRDLLERLVPEHDHPWSHSSEGLDDCCHYCGGWRHDWYSTWPEGSGPNGRPHTFYWHEPDCVWMEAMEYLGRSFDPLETHTRAEASYV